MQYEICIYKHISQTKAENSKQSSEIGKVVMTIKWRYATVQKAPRREWKGVLK